MHDDLLLERAFDFLCDFHSELILTRAYAIAAVCALLNGKDAILRIHLCRARAKRGNKMHQLRVVFFWNVFDNDLSFKRTAACHRARGTQMERDVLAAHLRTLQERALRRMPLFPGKDVVARWTEYDPLLCFAVLIMFAFPLPLRKFHGTRLCEDARHNVEINDRVKFSTLNVCYYSIKPTINHNLDFFPSSGYCIRSLFMIKWIKCFLVFMF